jgi:hypothetical protein
MLRDHRMTVFIGGHELSQDAREDWHRYLRSVEGETQGGSHHDRTWPDSFQSEDPMPDRVEREHELVPRLKVSSSTPPTGYNHQFPNCYTDSRLRARWSHSQRTE